MSQPIIRPARVDEAAALSGLAMRSKAHWGYDDAFMAMCVEALTVHPAQIEAGLVCVVADRQDRPVGHAGIEMIEPDIADLSAMFIEPTYIGRGFGRPLFEGAVAIARRAGATKLTILSDIQARGFYERMGARYVQDAPSDAIPGRMLPYLDYDL